MIIKKGETERNRLFKFLISYTLFLTPYTLFLTPYSLHLIPYSLFLTTSMHNLKNQFP